MKDIESFHPKLPFYCTFDFDLNTTFMFLFFVLMDTFSFSTFWDSIQEPH